MPYDAQFSSGNPLMVDHTPSGAAVPAGAVVVTNDTPRVCHRDIADGALGALAAEGGVYLMTGDGIIAADKRVYWDSTNKKITLTASTFKIFGVTVTACAGNNATCLVRHDPSA